MFFNTQNISKEKYKHLNFLRINLSIVVLSYFSSFVLEVDQVEQSSNIISVMLRKVHAITQSIYLFKTKTNIFEILK